ncbi:MAG TPA: hypothetical protein VGB53_07990 [Rubricoccaceae bacterium]|jgi:hypothetical protein
MVRLSVLLALVVAFPAAAQTGSPADYIFTLRGDTLRGTVDLHSPVLRRSYVTVDTQRVELDQVHELRMAGATYAVVDGRNLAQRLIDGRVDFYSRTRTTMTPGVMMPSGPRGGAVMSAPGLSQEEIGYIRVADGPVQRATVPRLLTALEDNPESVRLLRQHQNLTYAQYGTAAAGVGMIAGGLALSDFESESAVSGIHPLVFVGAAVTSLTNFVFPALRRGKIQQAIRTYNQ